MDIILVISKNSIINFKLTMSSSLMLSVASSIEKSLENSFKELLIHCIKDCASRHGFDANEELRILGLENIQLNKKEKVIKRNKKVINEDINNNELSIESVKKDEAVTKVKRVRLSAEEKDKREAEKAQKKARLIVEKLQKQALKDHEKALEKARKDEEKTLEKARKEEEKARKNEEKALEKARKDEEKRKKEEEKALLKIKKEEEKSRKKEGKKEEKEFKETDEIYKLVPDSPIREWELLSRVMINGKEYLKSKGNILYELKTIKQVGLYDPLKPNEIQ